MNALALVLPGVLVALGAWVVVLAFQRQHAQLGDALGVLADVAAPTDRPRPQGLDRVGGWFLERRPAVASPTLTRQLQLKGRTLTRHYSLKLLAAGAGFLLPILLGAAWWAGRGEVAALPALASLVFAAVGFIAPDLLLRGASTQVSEDATEALLTYFDLVTLERLANQSATQALHAAASLSDVAIFATVRAALERARLQQRMPYEELKQVGRHLDLPALVDLADVMRLDETGASLSTTLRARVKELRDAHLTRLKVEAAAVSERMTIFMVVPSLVFGLFFLVPALLRLAASS